MMPYNVIVPEPDVHTAPAASTETSTLTVVGVTTSRASGGQAYRPRSGAAIHATNWSRCAEETPR